MSATSLTEILDGLAEVRPALRGERVTSVLRARLRAGVAVWDGVIADIDAGGSAESAVDAAAAAFTTDDELAVDSAAARDADRNGLPSAEDRFLLAFWPVRRDLAKANESAVGQLRRAAVLEKRSRSRWRGNEGRASVRVDRDLVLEEVRVQVKAICDRARSTADALDGWLGTR